MAMRHVPLFLSKINVHLYLDFLRKHSFKVCALMWFESPVMRTTVINQFFFFCNHFGVFCVLSSDNKTEFYNLNCPHECTFDWGPP